VIDPIKRFELEDQKCLGTGDFPALSTTGEAYGGATVVQSDTVVDSGFPPRPVIEVARGIRAVELLTACSIVDIDRRRSWLPLLCYQATALIGR
jgi:hypothetical protein